MAKRWRIVAISFFIVVLCLILAIGATLALFTDGVTLTTHLKAGNIGGITLYRVGLASTTLDDSGKLVSAESSEEVDFSEATDENVFGISDDGVIVPGCSYEAVMELRNGSGIYVGYWLEIVLDGESNSLAEQLLVTVTVGENSYRRYLSEELSVGSETEPLSEIAAGSATQFTVKVEFIDADANNDAQDQEASFDLLVYVAQLTDSE